MAVVRSPILTPSELTGGTYANGMLVWSTPSEFTLDFVVSLPPVEDEEGVIAPQQLVARVKVPPPLVFSIMRNLASEMEKYEQVIGPIPEFRSGSDPSPESDD